MALSSNNLKIVLEGLRDSKIDYLRFTWCDLNGISKTKIVPAWAFEKFLKSGVTAACSVVAFGANGLPPNIKEDQSKVCSNCIILPVVNYHQELLWASDDDRKFAQIICETFWVNKTIQRANPRFAARAQLSKLNDLGYNLLSSYENEFILKKDGKLVFDSGVCETYNTLTTYKFESFLTLVEKNLRHMGIFCPTLEIEFGEGQFEITIECEKGIKAADNVFSFKEAVREIAIKEGMRASFMSKYSKTIGSSSHFNHSIISIETETNAFYDETNKHNMSVVCKHWIAGLVKHARALCAFFSPTVNCYKRLHKPYCPDISNWGYENRLASFRLVDNSSYGTYIENRIPSAASNPYLVLAATVAAGIDGIVHKLECPPMNNDKAERLPETLEEALVALENDKVLVEALGEELVEWFCISKRECEIEFLSKSEMTENDLYEEFF